MVVVVVVKTRRFYVFGKESDLKYNGNIDSNLSNYVYDGELAKCYFTEKLDLFGCALCSNLILQEAGNATASVLQPLIDFLISRYDDVEDAFCDIDLERNNIIRMPRIGNGKHNIHFDPHYSKQHLALNNLANDAGFDQLLSLYMGKSCNLRETGISITSPVRRRSPNSNPIPGEGMEWHSDGSRGEATVLMAIEDIDPDMGYLFVVPGSHREYKDGVGHEEVVILPFIHIFISF